MDWHTGLWLMCKIGLMISWLGWVGLSQNRTKQGNKGQIVLLLLYRTVWIVNYYTLFIYTLIFLHHHHQHIYQLFFYLIYIISKMCYNTFFHKIISNNLQSKHTIFCQHFTEGFYHAHEERVMKRCFKNPKNIC